MRHLALLGLVAALALAPAPAVRAQTPTSASPAQTATLPANAVAMDGATRWSDADQSPRHNCLRSTGTRIRSHDKSGCRNVASPSRSYTRSDIERTGETEVGEALQRLDPSISIR